jgi:hypothetical protein
MSPITIQMPGTGYGHCRTDCAHKDCAWQRITAATVCAHCGQPIGYDRQFYETIDGVVHTGCYADLIEKELTITH